MLVSAVLNDPGGAVSFVERIEAMHDITIADLMMALIITRVRVFYFVVVRVFRVRLKIKKKFVNIYRFYNSKCYGELFKIMSSPMFSDHCPTG